MATLATMDGQGKGVSACREAVTHIGDHDVVFRREPRGFRAVTVTVAGQIGARTVLSAGWRPARRLPSAASPNLNR
jgi:hypothetical protein